MSMHTPGPWTMRYQFCDVRITQVGNDHKNETIAQLGNWRAPYIDEQRANAQLIATSPEMAEALQAVAEALEIALGRLGVCGQGDGADHRADADSWSGTYALAQARSALKKAGLL